MSSAIQHPTTYLYKYRWWRLTKKRRKNRDGQQMSTLADNYFNCSETPANFPTNLKLSNVPGSTLSTLRIISNAPGPGNYTGPIDFFFMVNENPMTSIHYNSVMYNLGQTLLCFPGVHRVSREEKPCDAELILFFNPSQTSAIKQTPIMMCIPVDSGIKYTKKSAEYFNTITTGVTANRPTLGSILPPDTSFIAYRGFNFMLRVSDKRLKACGDIPNVPSNIIQYLICQTPIGMTVGDYKRFTDLLEKKPKPPVANDYGPQEQLIKPPRNLNDIAIARYTDLVTHITDIRVEANDVAAPAPIVKGEKGVPTSSMKCKRIDKRGKNGLKIDATKGGGSTLAQELATTQTDLNDMDLGQLDPGITPASPVKVKPGDIEKGISITLGIILGIIAAAFIAYWGLRLVYKNYTNGLKLYGSAPSSAYKPTSFKLPSLPAMPKLCP